MPSRRPPSKLHSPTLSLAAYGTYYGTMVGDNTPTTITIEPAPEPATGGLFAGGAGPHSGAIQASEGPLEATLYTSSIFPATSTLSIARNCFTCG